MKIVIDRDCFAPVRVYEWDAGMDLRTPIAFSIPPRGSRVIDTGVHVEIPKGYFGKLESKSGLNINKSIVSLGGVIDSGYTGSIRVNLYNFSSETVYFDRGDKIVQMVIQPCLIPDFEVVDMLDNTDRGNNGFGSTGR